MLGVTAVGKNIREAKIRLMSAGKISFADALHYRKDIAWRALKIMTSQCFGTGTFV